MLFPVFNNFNYNSLWNSESQQHELFRWELGWWASTASSSCNFRKQCPSYRVNASKRRNMHFAVFPCWCGMYAKGLIRRRNAGEVKQCLCECLPQEHLRNLWIAFQRRYAHSGSIWFPMETEREMRYEYFILPPRETTSTTEGTLPSRPLEINGRSAPAKRDETPLRFKPLVCVCSSAHIRPKQFSEVLYYI